MSDVIWPTDMTDLIAKGADPLAADVDLDEGDDGAIEVAKRLAGTGYAAEEPIRSPVLCMGTYRHMAAAISSQMPPHSTYIEPFVGPADIIFAKKPSDEEVINDLDPRITRIYRTIKSLTDNQIRSLKRRNWKLTVQRFRHVRKMGIGGDLDMLYKVFYLIGFSLYAKGVMLADTFDGGSPHYKRLGRRLQVPDRLESYRARLRGVTITTDDYREVYKRFGKRKGALWIIDPPYPGTVQYYKVADVDFDEMAAKTKALAGKWMLLFEATKEAARFKGQGVSTSKIRRRNTAPLTPADPRRRAANIDHSKKFALFASNDSDWLRGVVREDRRNRPDTTSTKKDADGDEDAGAAILVAPPVPAPDIKISVSIRKDQGGDEQYVFGVVLVPDETDSQGDTYNEQTVRDAAHNFLAEYNVGTGLGLQHKKRIDRLAKLVESYLAPVDMVVEGVSIKRGTWCMAWRVLDADLWRAIKSGEFTGFSIGGDAIRRPIKD